MKATNIILQGLPADIYSLVNHHRVAKDLWERVQLLMQGTSLTKQERECKMYDAFDKFTHIKRETLHNLPLEWSKFVTDVKLVKDLHTTNFDQLHAYLEQHELHANEVLFIQQSSASTTVSTILVWINSSQSTLLIFLSITTSIQLFIRSTIISISVLNESSTSSVLQIAYQSPQVTTQPMIEPPLVDSSFVVPVFSPGDDPIACLNKAMAFLTAVASSRYKSNATSFGGNNASGQTRVVKCYNYQGEGHMARQCTQPKRPRNATWYKDKAMLAEAQEAGQILDEEQLAFLVDLPKGQAVQTIIPNNSAFQTKDLDTYDSDYDDISNAKAVLMANISNYGFDVISEVPYSETYLNDMENQSVHAMQDFEQTPAEKANKEQNNESVTAELERYKERVKAFEQRLNIDLSSREKMINSQMDDMIKEKLALKEQVDSLEQNLSKQIKEKEFLLQTFNVFKSESKEKEDKYMENEIGLEKKIKELDNILFKVGQSAQTVHIKPSDVSPVKIEAPKELPKVSLVNESLKKLKFNLAGFDNVVKIKTTPDARTEDEWGFDHTKAVFNNEIILFLKSLKDFFNVFDRDLLNEIMEYR
ncbi:integrase, catalytic region, zinc finger, CCHC-type containing protein [Tanacetum coccineum]